MEPYYSHGGIEIYHGDCMEILPHVRDVDAVITDPPYGIDFQSARRSEAERLDKVTNDGLPFVWWLFGAAKVMCDSSPLLCFCRWDVQEAFRSSIEWSGLDVRSQIIWNRGVHGLGDLNGQAAPQHDVIWFARKGDYEFPGGRPKSVLTSMRVTPDNLMHPNEKPVALIAHLMRMYTNPGDVVFDPFLGSGTSVEAAKQTDRQLIGIEIEEKYCEIAAKRLSQEVLDFKD